jgi:hypothetical protein
MGMHTECKRLVINVDFKITAHSVRIFSILSRVVLKSFTISIMIPLSSLRQSVWQSGLAFGIQQVHWEHDPPPPIYIYPGKHERLERPLKYFMQPSPVSEDARLWPVLMWPLLIISHTPQALLFVSVRWVMCSASNRLIFLLLFPHHSAFKDVGYYSALFHEFLGPIPIILSNSLLSFLWPVI